MKHKVTLWLAALLAACVLLTPLSLPVMAQGRSVFGWVVANRATIQSGGLVVTGNTALSSATHTPATTIAVTMNATITPQGTYQPLSSAGTVNTSSITAGAAGDLLILENTTATSIVFTDTGTLKLSGNLTLGQFDSVTLISDGTNWIQLATSNN